MDEIHVHKTKKSICAHFAESPCNSEKEREVQFRVILQLNGVKLTSVSERRKIKKTKIFK